MCGFDLPAGRQVPTPGTKPLCDERFFYFKIEHSTFVVQHFLNEE